MNTLRQVHTENLELLSMPIEQGLKSPRRLSKVIQPHIDVVHFDMSSVTMMNAKELGKIIRLHRTLKDQGKQMKLVNVSLRVMLFLELTKADAIFDISLNQDQYSGFAA